MHCTQSGSQKLPKYEKGQCAGTAQQLDNGHRKLHGNAKEGHCPISVHVPNFLSHGYAISVHVPNFLSHGYAISVHVPNFLSHGYAISVHVPNFLSHGYAISVHVPNFLSHGYAISVHVPNLSHGYAAVSTGLGRPACLLLNSTPPESVTPVAY